jgi:hypothetical protein
MNKTWAHLHIFSKKIKLTHRCFKSSPSNYSNWIDCLYFLHVWSNKIRVSPTSIVSSLSPSWCRLSSDRRHYVTVTYHTSFPWSQDELTASASSFDNASSYRLSSWAKTEALNSHHCYRSPSTNSSTPTLYYYKKVTLTLVTLPITQSCLHFTSSLARAPRHQSSARRYHSISPPFHTHRPSVQWYIWWWTSRPSFTF